MSYSRFHLLAVLSGMMKAHAVLLCPAQDVIIPSPRVSMLCTPPNCQPLSSRLRYQPSSCNIAVLVLKSLLFYCTVAPKHKGSDAGNSDSPKKARKCMCAQGKTSSVYGSVLSAVPGVHGGPGASLLRISETTEHSISRKPTRKEVSLTTMLIVNLQRRAVWLHYGASLYANVWDRRRRGTQRRW